MIFSSTEFFRRLSPTFKGSTLSEGSSTGLSKEAVAKKVTQARLLHEVLESSAGCLLIGELELRVRVSPAFGGAAASWCLRYWSFGAIRARFACSGLLARVPRYLSVCRAI